MGSRLVPILLLFIIFILPSNEVEGLGITVDSTIPEYILDDYLNIRGSTNVHIYTWKEERANQFSQGDNHNTTVNTTLDEVRLVPALDIRIMNNGNGILKGGGSDWDKYIIDEVVVEHNGTYYMYYTAGTTISPVLKYALQDPYHIGVATSTDGVNWTRYSGNPVVRSRVDSYDYTNVMYPVVIVENGTFHMYYAGNKGNSGSSSLQDISICYANSTDGINFTKYSKNPVLTHGSPQTAWNGLDVRPGSIGRDFDGKLRMYIKAVGVNQPSNLGVVTSTDYLNWSYVVNKAIYAAAPTSWEWSATNYNHLEMKNGTYRIWTHANKPDWEIGWIWSPDGLNWSDSGAPIIKPKAGTIYEKFLDNPHCIEMADHYRLYVTCWDNSGNRQVALFKAAPTKLDGTFRSAVKDLGSLANLHEANSTTNAPNGSEVRVHLRWSNDSQTWSGWSALDGSWSPEGVSARYVQYKADFKSQWDWLRPGLKAFSLNYTYPITLVETSVDGAAWKEANWSQSNWRANVSLHDGDYDVEVRVTDTRGSTATRVVPVKVDLFPPTGGILIEDGRYATNSTSIKIDVAANDTHHPIQMQLARNPDFIGAQWWPHYPSETYGLLDEPEGNVTIYLRLRDAAGRISETYNDSIVIDTTPPEGRLLINDGAKYTNSTTVTLSLEWTDLTGVVNMMVSNDPDFEGAIWQDPMDAMSWMIGETDGVHTVYAKIQDFVGWETVLSDDIILDRTPPAASLSINRDAPFTTTRDVTLNITLYDENPISYKLVNAGEPWPDSWRSTASPVDIPWTLTSGADGHREVLMLVRDAAINEFVTSDDIVLDTTPPEGTVSLNNGVEFTNALLVSIALMADDDTSGLDRMRVSNTDDFSGAAWQTVKENFSWTLPPGDGTKTVFLQLRDVAGLVSTIDASIILDTTPPEGTVTIRGVDGIAREPGVELEIDMTDDFVVDRMMVSSDAAFPDSSWVPYGSLYPWDLGDVDGEVTVYVRVRDLAGNTFTASASTILDTTPPELEAEMTDHTLTRTVGFTWSASDDIGLDVFVLEVFDMDGRLVLEDSEGLDGVNEVSGRSDTLEISPEMTPGEEAAYKFTVELRVGDLALWGKSLSFELTYVARVPAGSLVIDNGAEWTNSTIVDLSLSHTGGLSPTNYRVALSEADLGDAAWQEWVAATTIDLGTTTGERSVWCQLKGDFDIASEPFSDTIRLDLQAPLVEIVSPARDIIEEDSVKLSIAVSDDQDTAPTVEYRLNGGEWTAYTVDVKLSLKEGRNVIEARSRDAAGNVGLDGRTIDSDRGLSVGGASWLILIVIAVVVALVALWYWRNRTREPVD